MAATAPRADEEASRRRRLGTAARLAAFHLVLLGIVLGVVVTAVVRQLSASYEQIAAGQLVTELHDLSRGVPAAGSQGCGLITNARSYLRTHELPGGTVVAVGALGCRAAGQGEIAAGSATMARALLADAPTAQFLGRPPASSIAGSALAGGRNVEYLAAPVRVGGKVVGTFVAETDLAPLLSNRARVVRLSLAEAAIALLAGVASAYWLLRRQLRTVGRITTAAEEIERGEIDRRLGDQGTDHEVGQLASTFDRMLDRISGAITAQRRLLSDVSHQLRTPLTVARGHLEVLERTGAGDERAVRETVSLVIEELDHMRALVERLLLLGRAMEPDFLALGPVDLRSLLADLHAAAGAIAPRELSLSPVPDVVLSADEAKLRGALLNLIDNAIRATRPGDSIRLSAAGVAGGDLVLAVDDSGPGIEPDRREAVLARFSRPGAPDEDGSGLGLAIAKTVAEAHGGTLRLSSSDLGGCRAEIRLPAGALSRPSRLDEPDGAPGPVGAVRR